MKVGSSTWPLNHCCSVYSCYRVGPAITFHAVYTNEMHAQARSGRAKRATLLVYEKHNVCVCVCACVCNGRSPEVIRPLAKCYFFLWAMATVGQREGAQWAGIHNASLGLNDRLCTQGWWRVWSSTRPTCDIASRRGSSTWVPLLHIKA